MEKRKLGMESQHFAFDLEERRASIAKREATIPDLSVLAKKFEKEDMGTEWCCQVYCVIYCASVGACTLE